MHKNLCYILKQKPVLYLILLLQCYYKQASALKVRFIRDGLPASTGIKNKSKFKKEVQQEYFVDVVNDP